MFYVDNNNFCMLKNTKERNSERYLRRSLFIKVVGCNFTSCNFTKINFFCRFSFTFDKKCGLTTFRWLHLFIVFTQVVFTEEFCFIETTLLPKLDQSNEIRFAAFWWALIISGRCNTLFK